MSLFSNICASLLLLMVSLNAGAAGPAAWSPDRNVEIVIPTGPAGANDRLGRLLQKIWQGGMVGSTATVVNKPGGGGAVGWAYLNQHPADAHYLAIAPNFFLTNAITGRSTLAYTDFVPVAVLASEYVSFIVKAESPIRTGADLAARLRQDPASVNFSLGGTLGGSNHIAIGLLAKAAGADPRKLKIIVFNGTGEATTALLGGHIDVLAAGGDTAVRQAASGKGRVIAISSARRLAGALSAVPTWREQGFDVLSDQWRAIIAPRGTTPAQLAYWDDVFAKTVATEEWKKALEATLIEPNYMASAQTAAFLKSESARLTGVLGELGLAK